MIRRALLLAVPLMSTGCFLMAPRPAGRTTAVMSSVKQVNLGLTIYRGDYDEVSPPVTWRPVLIPYVKRSELFEDRRPENPFIFAHRATLIGKPTEKIPFPEQTAVLFDVAESCDPFLAELPALAYRKRGSGSNPVALVGFLDAHVKPITKGTLVPLR